MRLLVPPRVDWVGLRRLAHREADDAAVATQLGRALVDAGVADGPARFYEREFAAGKSLLLVEPAGDASLRLLLHLYGGRDLEDVGGALARAPELATDPLDSTTPVGPTLDWPAVAAHYEMLFDQRYGAEDATWAEYEPAYRFAWELAHQPRDRGRQWSDVANRVRRAWQALGTGPDWDDVEGGMGDVWQDVVDDGVSVG